MAINWTGSIFKKLGQLAHLYNSACVQDRTTIRDYVKTLAQSYLTDQYPLETDVACTYQSFDDCWEQLKSLMVSDSQTINGNAVTGGSITITGTGTPRLSDASGTPDQITATQMLLNGDVIRLRYDGSRWSINSLKRGLISGYVSTDTLYGVPGLDIDRDANAGQDLIGYQFTVLSPVSRVHNDGGGLLATTQDAIAGGAKNTNCDADGKVYLKIVDDGGGTYHVDAWDTSAHRTTGTSTGKVFHTAGYTTTGAKSIVADNTSGLSGTITIAATGADDSVEITLKIALADGDEITFGAATVSDDGVFQTFFRDALGKVLPSTTGGTETISDDLATDAVGS